jgi:hypothetical protein
MPQSEDSPSRSARRFAPAPLTEDRYSATCPDAAITPFNISRGLVPEPLSDAHDLPTHTDEADPPAEPETKVLCVRLLPRYPFKLKSAFYLGYVGQVPETQTSRRSPRNCGRRRFGGSAISQIAGEACGSVKYGRHIQAENQQPKSTPNSTGWGITIMARPGVISTHTLRTTISLSMYVV